MQGLIDVLKSNPNIILQFAGVGEDKDIKEITDLRDKEGLGEQVKLLGFVKDMEKLWSETDIAIVYSKFEAFGRVTVEAKMSGALVVGYNSGGTTELINDGEDGFLFENGYAPLGDVVKNIISDPEHAGIIADTGRRLSSQVFTSENNAKQIFELYKNILSEC